MENITAQYTTADASFVRVAVGNFETLVPSDAVASRDGRCPREFLVWLEEGGVIAPYVAPAPDFKAPAQAALDSSDTTIIRCAENNIKVPKEWRAYRVSLRSIIKSGVGPLPDRPAYPAGT